MNDPVLQVSKISNGYIVTTPATQSPITQQVKPGVSVFCKDIDAVSSNVRSMMIAHGSQDGFAVVQR